MSQISSKLKTVLGIGSVCSFYGIVSLLMFMAPIRLGFMERTIIVLLFLIVTLPFVILLGWLNPRRKKKKAANEAEAPAGVEDASVSNGKSASANPSTP